MVKSPDISITDLYIWFKNIRKSTFKYAKRMLEDRPRRMGIADMAVSRKREIRDSDMEKNRCYTTQLNYCEKMDFMHRK